MPRSTQKYVGRFAPSPTGPLHFGSIVAALGSYLDARSHNGLWLLRVDDLDTPRVQPGANDEILYALEQMALDWDESILYQSQRQEAYIEAAKKLKVQELLYHCYCSRKIVGGLPYPGTCRQAEENQNKQHAVRIRTEPKKYSLLDLIQGQYSQNLYEEVGDFIIKRSDGIYAYHLAVAVDDAFQGITHVVRGADLLESTPRQIYLQQQLNLETPVYAHLPVAVSKTGQKISKQGHAKDVNLQSQPARILFDALKLLGQKPEMSLLGASVEEVIHWGIENWKLIEVPKVINIVAPEEFQ